jgi:hypothetical protein
VITGLLRTTADILFVISSCPVELTVEETGHPTAAGNVVEVMELPVSGMVQLGMAATGLLAEAAVVADVSAWHVAGVVELEWR